MYLYIYKSYILCKVWGQCPPSQFLYGGICPTAPYSGAYEQLPMHYLKHYTVQFISFYTQKGMHFGMFQPGGKLSRQTGHKVLTQIDFLN